MILLFPASLSQVKKATKARGSTLHLTGGQWTDYIQSHDYF